MNTADLIMEKDRRIADLTAALKALVEAEEDYGDPDNMAVNQALYPAKEVLERK